MNREEFISELNKRDAFFELDNQKYSRILAASFIVDGDKKKLQISQEE